MGTEGVWSVGNRHSRNEHSSSALWLTRTECVWNKDLRQRSSKAQYLIGSHKYYIAVRNTHSENIPNNQTIPYKYVQFR